NLPSIGVFHVVFDVIGPDAGNSAAGARGSAAGTREYRSPDVLRSVLLAAQRRSSAARRRQAGECHISRLESPQETIPGIWHHGHVSNQGEYSPGAFLLDAERERQRGRSAGSRFLWRHGSVERTSVRAIQAAPL